MANYFVYILECINKDGTMSLYTGHTNSIDRRLDEHASGKGALYTKYKTVQLVFYQRYTTRSAAMKREREIKKLSAKQKEELIKNVFVNEFIVDSLKELK